MANTNLKPKEVRFGQIFFSTNYDVGDRAEMEIFTITVVQEKVIYHTSDIISPPVTRFEEMDDNMVLIFTKYSNYVCYKGHSTDEKYNYVTINEIPIVGKEIEIIGHSGGTGFEGTYFSKVTPEWVNDRFAEYDMYIFKAKGKFYLCYLR